MSRTSAGQQVAALLSRRRAPASPSRCRWSRCRRTSRPRFSPPPGARPQPPAVLLIEDDDFGRETLGRILEVDGYRVLRAASAAEALDRLRGRPRPRLIVLDLPPGRCARQAVRRLAGAPIVLVSDDDPCSEDGPPGVIAHFAKPVAVAALLAVIHHYLPSR
jgi:CheY-like chemotaxis protein